MKRFENTKENYPGLRDGFEVLLGEYDNNEIPVFQVFFIEFTNDWDTPVNSVKDTARKYLKHKSVKGKSLFVVNAGVHYKGYPRDMYKPVLETFLKGL